MNQEILRKIEIGDPLTDRELDTAFKFYTKLTQDLRLLGNKFHLAWAETFRMSNTLEGYIQARKNAKAWSFK